ncbi:MAG: HD domain-containing protein [Candidatus Hermodarchaeota archaeon]
MPIEKEFEELFKNFANSNTINRAASVSNSSIRILEINKERGFIDAEIQGNSIVPYKLSIDISKRYSYDIINHNCPDFLARKKPNNKFCKHIAKFFLNLCKQDPEFAIMLLTEFNSKISVQVQVSDIDLEDMNHFVNQDLKNQLDFDYKGFDFFFELSKIGDDGKTCLKEILMEAKRLPAALRGFHGGYEGGLFDHILLVTNYTYIMGKSEDFNVDLKKAVLTAIYHDFGKISYYSFKRKNITSKIAVAREELDIVHEDISNKFNYEGRDYHVEEAVAVIKNQSPLLFFDDEMYKAIIFHHGQWSKYYPIEMSELATLIHTADMIASQTHFV